jgi:hypothetical protein
MPFALDKRVCNRRRLTRGITVNIFVTDPCPVKSATALDDSRLNKMILESAQLLSNAIHEHVPDLAPLVYEKVNFNQRCSRWARATRSNYSWLLEHLTALLFEKVHRTDRVHTTMRLLDLFREAEESIPEGELTEFPNSSYYKDDENVLAAYRKTLLKKWINAKVVGSKSWTNREPPPWLKGKVTESGGVYTLDAGRKVNG